MHDFLQFVMAGVTVGAIYALVALGFTIVYNASGVINFAQGDFVMLGGMVTVALIQLQVHPLLAAGIAIVATTCVAGALERFGIAPAGRADPLTLIIITIGASLFIQGGTQLLLGKNQHTLPSFSGDTPLEFAGARLLPQSLWIIGVAAVLMVLVALFFKKTLIGRAIRAVAMNRSAAQLVGIPAHVVTLLSFGLAGLLGAIAGITAAPITTTVYDLGLMLGMKGFVAASLGGLGSGAGAVVGGLLVGLLEALIAGYVSSAYKDAVPFIMIIGVLLLMPRGIFGGRLTERV
ncbi:MULTISPECIES: branched-chain amino acid ABC transporter permease [Pandoraea]|uniref:ABC transporter permease n=1 Tax=Pandoraea capi TaxID=2508286 RepID=A0ABY6W4T7_9BURK|nr:MULTISPECIES: branched-chain amino acid ABC transporter permease [Pandoraea]MCI3208680.1 branched-chain amino acid ABC transporter permease [Pandoraea sp. LA3]MDN4586709.1 branched-chain amino acid ABC transporter permease [Pandoraea capi]VVE26796.1 ABC transporter permease [Pandoraea capi]